MQTLKLCLHNLLYSLRKYTPQPYLDLATEMKSDLTPRPEARFYRTDLKTNITAIGGGTVNGVFIAVGLYNSYENISNSSNKPLSCC